MSKLKVPIKEIRETATKIRNLSSDNSDIFQTIGNLIEAAEGTEEWTGKSAEALKTATDKNSKEFEKTLKELCDLADFLEQYADAMDAADADVKSQIGS